MSNIFSECVITFSGKFETGSHSQLGELVRQNGGQVIANVNKSLTHLVVTKDDFMKPSNKVKTARKNDVSFVTWDWIQQSIEKGMKLAETAFHLGVNDTANTSTEVEMQGVDNISNAKSVSASHKEIDINETRANDKDETEPKPGSKRRRKDVTYDTPVITTRSRFSNSGNPSSSPVNQNNDDNINDVNEVAMVDARNDEIENKEIVSEEILNQRDNESDNEQAKPAKKRQRQSKSSANSYNAAAPEAATVTTTRKRGRKPKNLSNEKDNDNVDVKTSVADIAPVAINEQITDIAETIEEEKKMVTIIKKGAAAVDSSFQYKNTTHVFVDEEAIWDCLLNQTNVKNNNNKYFVIQLLQSDSGTNYYVFTRWGRVGYNGTSATYGPTSSLDSAKHEFQRKFYDKTRNRWLDVCKNISAFTPIKSKYTLLERDYGGDGKEKEIVTKPRESKLHPKVQDIIQMIFDVGSWNDTMIALNYDASKLPLGKLSKATVNQGYLALKRIAAVLNGEEQGDLTELSNAFYTVIPHNFGMRKPPIISSNEVLKLKLQMVETLGEIEIASALLNQANESSKNQLDAYYDSLMLETMEPLDHNSEEFKLILKYVENTQGATHDQYKLEVLEVFDLERQGERERYKPFSDFHNRMLLWHGSRKTNYAGILSQGLRIAPPHVPSTGYMFGKGVYFADCVSKSANYCFTDNKNNIGLMLLCEVALGDMLELVDADYNADRLVKKEGKHCTKGLGLTIPNPNGSITLENGTVVPCGKGINSNNANYLQYNEYIVYDVNQIFQKYLLKVKFNYKYY
ncbi:1192_t:CDS:2 [Ambispora leptoticha]|uniref:Poly [ADP-ribose] polymerase n=1 Tax=Ambispora leptoticha TaxID=144679 RepID=A0A9N8Z4P2_9GLOM|nr:1192_t:CDS:2 [Ambispora leptoticha]